VRRVTVAEIAPRGGDEFERTPPHDLAAEQCVLGGMLLSKDAISDVLEVIKGTDFYRPAHQIVHEVILDLYGRGEPADAVTVAAELTRRGDIGRMGGAPYLHTLIASVPTAANAGYYARIVRERAILRRLVEVGTRIVQLGYSGDGDADELVDRAEAEVYGVTDHRVSEDYAPLSEIMPGALDEIEAIGSRGGSLTGVPTGFADLDALTNGLHPGQMVVVAARPAIGKALALDTPLPTPAGWTTMGEVQVGDFLLGADGRPTRVVAATEIMTARPCFEVEFSDGTAIVADAGHQWRTTTRASRRQRSETQSSWYWPKAARQRLRDAYAIALREPDRCVTAAEVLAMVGQQFKVLLHAAGREVGIAAERVPVRVRRLTGKTHTWSAPVYASRHALLAGMVSRADQPRNAAITVVHHDVVTTAQLAATLRAAGDGRLNHAVSLTQPADLPASDLPFPPYSLGAWLGDGTSRAAQVTTADPEIVAAIEAEGLSVIKTPSSRLRYSIQLPKSPPPSARPCAVCGTPFTPRTSEVRTCGRTCGARSRALLGPRPPACCPDCGQPSSGTRRCRVCHAHHGTAQAVLRSMGVLGNKHIPVQYLRASQAQRRALLAGLLDTDGYVNKTGTVQFAVTSERLAEDTMELILSLGYRATMTTKVVPGRTAGSSTCFIVTFTPYDPVFRLSRKLARQSTRLHPAAQCRFVADVRPVASVPVRCVQVDNADHMYLAGRTWIPTHNSTLALDFARSAAVHAGMTTVIFSLEMSRNEITMRLLSAEARVGLHAMRTGQLGDEDWTRLARRMSEVADSPLFIDDSPNMSMMEIRAKCRRLKQRNDLKLVIIDYLQLMSSPKRVENRQQEVSELSRSLKLLAKELGVPVIALSQLNRGPEQRTDKRPMLSDLRESGCMTAATRIMRADTNEEVTFGELMAAGATDIPVWALDERLKYVKATMTHVFPTGRRETYLLRLASGRQVEATMNHRFLTLDGWQALADLPPGSRIASQRLAHHPLAQQKWPEERVVLLAHLLGDGSFLRRQPLRYASVDEANLSAVTEAAQHFGVLVRRDEYAAARVTTLRLSAPFTPARGHRNPVIQWLDDLGLYDLRSHEKFVPGEIFALPDDQLALFLRHLWATDGSVTVNRNLRGGRIYYASTSRRLIDDVASLLRRFGINGRVRTAATPDPHRPQYTVDVSGREDQLLFLRMIGGFGPRAAVCARLLKILEPGVSNTNIDTVPSEVWLRVRDVLAEKNMTHRQFAAAMGTQFCGSTLWKHAPSRARLSRVADALGDADMEMLATNDVIWDTIVSVEPLGEQEVYDATVIGLHNFVANGIAAHNSIEQDSDMVILLHREDAYERESPRAGEADFIVAKHRNGPTATVTVAFQGHYSRFVDMAPI
jgi:replicative DNA helicase